MSFIPLKIKQRTRFEYEFFVNDGDKPPNAIDITDRTYKAQMRETPSGPLVAEFHFDIQDQTVPEGKGRVIMSLAGSVTKDLPAGSYVYDVFQTMKDKDPDVMFYGSVEVEAAVTR